MPSVSIIIAAHRAARFIEAALESALAQSGVDVEVIVVDDASDDGTAEMVEAYVHLRSEHRVRLLRRQVNAGPAAARNLALATAEGEWLCVLDADDRMAPERVHTLLQAASSLAADIVTDNLWICNASGLRLRRHLDEPDDGVLLAVDFREYVLQNLMFAGRPALGYLKPVFKRSFLQGRALAYDETLRIGEDFLLVADALAEGARFVRVRRAFYDYTTRAGSISHRLSAQDARCMREADDDFLKRHAEQLSKQGVAAMRKHRRHLDDAQAFVGAVEALQTGRPVRAARLALRRPLSLRHFHMPLRARLKRLLQPTSSV